MFNVYKNQLSRQTGSRNLTGPKTLPTIWYTYMTLVTKYQISAINTYWEKCDEKYLGRTDGGKTVYPPPPLGSGCIIINSSTGFTVYIHMVFALLWYDFMLWFDGLQHHFQQYFSYIMAVNFIGGGNHRPFASHWQTLSHNVVQLALSWSRTHSISDDRHRLHR